MTLPTDLDALSPEQLRKLAAQLMAEVDEKTRELHHRQAQRAAQQRADELARGGDR
jgi:hypothetical protein